MKNLLTLLCIQFIIVLLGGQWSVVRAQAPNAIPYQAVARNSSGDLITNQNISLRFSIRDVSASGSILYQETQAATTNAYGLFSVNIGQGAMLTIYGNFSQITWSAGSKYLQVEMDAIGGTNFIDMGTTQLLSVPYALYAASSGSSSWTVNGNNQYSAVSDSVGIGTSSPQAKLNISGKTNDILKLQSSSSNGSWLKLTNTSSGGNTYSIISTGSSNGEGAGKLLFNSPGGLSMIMDASGNVGVGTTSPSVKLHIKGSTNRLLRLESSSGIGTWLDLINNSGGTTYSIISSGLSNSEGASKLLFRNSTSTLMTLTSTGLGIGTSSPSQALEVNGTTKTTNLQITSGASNGYVLQSDANGNATWVNTSSFANNAWSVSGNNIYNGNSGNVGIGLLNPANKFQVETTGDNSSAILAKNFSSAAGTSWNQYSNYAAVAGYGASGGSYQAGVYGYVLGISNNTSGVLGLWDVNNWGGLGYKDDNGNEWGVYANGNAYLSGNVGIGTLSPNAPLDVNGTIQTQGFRMSNGANNGSVLVSDNMGNASWTDPSNYSHWSGNGSYIYNNNGSNVGIGTLSPNAALEVSSTDGNSLIVSSTFTDETSLKLQGPNIGSATLEWTGSASSLGQQKLLFRSPGEDVVMTLDEQQDYVGIGTTSPQNRLDVNGTIRTTGLTLPTGAVNGYVLQTDANGVANWASPTSVGNWLLSGNNIYSNNSGNVSIGVSNPQATLDVSGNIALDDQDDNDGNIYPGGLSFGSGISGEGIASKRTPGGNRYGLDFYTNYSNRMTISNGGNVGIGTSSPEQKLDVNGTIGTQGLRMANGASNGYVLESDADGYASWVNPDNVSHWETTDLSIYNTNAGFVGIGTSSPNSSLDVSSSDGNTLTVSSTSSSNTTVFLKNASGSARMIYTGSSHIDGNDKLEFRNGNNDPVMTINENALYVGIGTTSPSEKLDVNGTTKTSNFQMTNGAGNGYLLESDASGNANWISPSSFAGSSTTWTQNSNDQYSALSGNIGIGTVTPSQKLEVSGTTKTSGFQMTNGGTNGYVMQSDASGNASWVNPNSLADGRWNLSGSNEYAAVSGNVGIGTTSPGSKLHVFNSSSNAAIKVESGTTNAFVNIAAGASGAEASIAAFTGSSQRWSFGKSNGSESGSNVGSDFFINRYDDAGTFLSQPFLIKRSSGNIGIGGIGTPDTKLQIVNGTDAALTSGTGYLVMGSITSTNMVLDDNEIMARNNGAKSGLFLQNDGGDFNVHNAQAGGSQFIVKDDGSTGIGTSSPSAMLHTIAYGAKTTAYSGNLLTNTATSGTSSITKAGVEIQSTGSWIGTSASNIGLYVSSVTGGTNNYDAVFNGGGNVGIGTTTPTQKLDVNGAVKLGANGTAITNIIKTTGTTAALVIAANTTSIQTYTVTNAVTTSSVMVSPASALNAGIVIAFSRVSASNTVEVSYRNTTNSSITLTSGITLYITTIQ